MLSYLIPGMTLAFAAAVQPGPLFTFLTAKALSQGWRSTLPAAAAPLISDLPIFLLAIFVLNLVPERILSMLHFAGGIYLLYLCWRTYLSWRQFNPQTETGKGSGKQTLFSAVVVNLLNPAPYLGWTTVLGPLFLQGWKESPAHGLALVAGFYSTMLISLALIILLFSTLRQLGYRVTRYLLALSILALAGLGVFEIIRGFNYL